MCKKNWIKLTSLLVLFSFLTTTPAYPQIQELKNNLRKLAFDEARVGFSDFELTPEIGAEWVKRISDAVHLPNIIANRQTPNTGFVSFGRFGNNMRDNPLYLSANLGADFIRAYDNQANRFVKDTEGVTYDRGLKVELPGGFIARFVDFKEPIDGVPCLGIVIHKGEEEVARLSLERLIKQGNTNVPRGTSVPMITNYSIPWMEVNKAYRGKAIARALINAAVTIAQNDKGPHRKIMDVITSDPATLVVFWDLGFQWKTGFPTSTTDSFIFTAGDDAYMRLINAIIVQARKAQSSPRRRGLYGYLWNGESNPGLGIINRDGIRFAGTAEDRRVRPNGIFFRDISLTTEQAIGERHHKMWGEAVGALGTGYQMTSVIAVQQI